MLVLLATAPRRFDSTIHNIPKLVHICRELLYNNEQEVLAPDRSV